MSGQLLLIFDTFVTNTFLTKVFAYAIITLHLPYRCSIIERENHMKRTTFWKRALCSLLCGVLIVGFLPPKTSAAESKAETQTSTEVTALREENVKHFDMGNGTYQAIMYSHPVHKKDSEGNWQDIDFGMSLTRSASASVYTSKAAGAAFAASYTPDASIMTLNGEACAISMSLVVPQLTASKRTPVAAKITEPTGIKNFEDAKTAKFSSAVLYEEVIPGVDLEYIAGIGGVKENIIVKSPMESYAFTFALTLEGLRPELQTEGHVLIYDEDTKELKYEIPMPFMYDGMKNICGDVSYALEEANGTYYLTVSADADWINAEGRTFPVTIDPSFTATDSTVLDTYISSTLPASNLGSSAQLWIRYNRITYIRPQNTFTPPDGLDLIDARLLCDYYYYDYVTGGSMYISAHRAVKNWSESTNWNTAAGWDNYGLAEKSLSYGKAYGGYHIETPGTVSFDITEAAKGWADGTMPNYGIGLCFVEGNMSVILVSSESGVSSGPRFTYKYARAYYYKNYYDSTMEGRTEDMSFVVEEALCTAFSEQFGIYMYETGSPTQINSLTDACTYGANAGCGPNCGNNHHKDIYSIQEYLLSLLEQEEPADRERIVFWTDHDAGTYCNLVNGSCETIDLPADTEPVIAVVIGYSPVIHMLNMVPDDGTDAQIEACMGINLIHETAHTFGLNDRYDAYTHNSGGFQCVMEPYADDENKDARDFYIDIMKKDCEAFCAGCAADFREVLSNN